MECRERRKITLGQIVRNGGADRRPFAVAPASKRKYNNSDSGDCSAIKHMKRGRKVDRGKKSSYTYGALRRHLAPRYHFQGYAIHCFR